ncbi:MAG: VTT domain-containing protein [Clostridiales Family XIII bacterium]|jgi:uncharacterized membrane protein YdjX (TVP38/TMEM64 family)|nr:VTT domain-containing protein [Clostridiales Family XIII bacterium]
MKEKGKKRIRNAIAILKFVLMLVIIFGVPLAIFLMNPGFIENFKNFESINDMLGKYKVASYVFFISAQILQVVISFIPGQAIQFATGYSYDFWPACLITFTGITTGTIITFHIAKLLGSDAMHLIFGEEKLKKYIKTLNSKKAYIAIFVIFLIPGIPKDMFTYAAGISEMKATGFTVLTMCARAPALMASILFGNMLRSGSYTGMIIMGVIVVTMCILGLIHRAKLTDLVDRVYSKLVKEPK